MSSTSLSTTSRSRRTFFIGAIGNLSVQYNLSCLGIAVAFMTSYRDQVVQQDSEFDSDFSEPAWAKSALFGTVFAGSMIGMIAMGRVGDLLGRRIGMIVTLAFVVVGALGSALLTWGNPNAVFGVLATFRFVLGFGVGGIYPMAAATAHEGAESANDTPSNSNKNSNLRVAWCFFFQAPGAMLPYLLALPLLPLPKAAWTTSVQFRLILAFGAVVAMIPLVAAWTTDTPVKVEPSSAELVDSSSDTAASITTSVTVLPGSKTASLGDLPPDDNKNAETPKETSRFLPDRVRAASASSSVIPDIREPISGMRSNWLTLIGTGGTWFLYDVCFYSTNIFTPTILASIFGASDTIASLTYESLAVTLMGVPACACAILLMKRYGGKMVSTYGFVFIAAAFAALALAVTLAPRGYSGLKFALFALVTVSLNAGPNVTTYVLPASLFPVNVRGTFHGLSAAAGKAGAVFGAFVFPPLVEQIGLGGVLWMQVGIALLGAVISSYFLANEQQQLPP